LAAIFGFALIFTFSCSDNSSSKNSSYYISVYGISDGATCQYLDEILPRDTEATEDDWEGKGYSFADVKGIWDQYRLSGTGVMLSNQVGYTDDVLRTEMTRNGATSPEINGFMRGLNLRGNVVGSRSLKKP